MAKKDTIDKLIGKINAFEKAYKSTVDSSLYQLGITPSQFKVLKALHEMGQVRHKELTERTLISKGTLTGVINRLEKKNYVKRQADSSDGRVQRVMLTEEGAAAYESLSSKYHKLVRNLFRTEPESRLQQHIANLAALQSVIEQEQVQP
ncbi:MarR family winged helix-turn-helix transcriptional regulator [Desulfurispira natronophila]|uniref:DNA-binding MarR family transcriptional regulator n=1 Tax=Desulfurispira natronophila TaxID=682562 RepID=A0A7W7Y4V5_9BACT|nr:MarR family transcriptional regulator [Desulfurispira natronophila]MBB5021822.1 DNA-binding MarR family transcriptional regulator [Desulfurispira natronophila]